MSTATLAFDPKAPTFDTLVEVPVELIDRTDDNHREDFDTGMAELVASIQAVGIQAPLVLRPKPRAKGRFEIVAGERRWRAAQQAGLVAVPAFIRRLTDEQAEELRLTENFARLDPNPAEQAKACGRARDRFGWSKATIAERSGMATGRVDNLLKIHDRLCTTGKEALANNLITVQTALEIIRVESAAQQQQLVNKIVAGKLTVYQLREIIPRVIEQANREAQGEMFELVLEDVVAEVKGTKKTFSRKALADEVRKLALRLEDLGVTHGDEDAVDAARAALRKLDEMLGVE